MPAQREVVEEGRTILRRIVEAQAYRQLMAMNIRGHCLKYFAAVDAKVRVAEELQRNLVILREVRTLYRALGWEDLESAVRDKMARIPYPESWLEFGVFRHVCGLALEIAMEGYAGSSNKELAAIARSFLEGQPADLAEPAFDELCADPGNRPLAQQMLNRWFAIAVRSLGRPGTPGDQRAVELGLRTEPTASVIRRFVEALRPHVARWALSFPDAQEYGLALPPGAVGA